MDKNPEQVLDNTLEKIFREFSNKNPNMVLSSEPFMKSQFLNYLIESTDLSVIFLDFDLLYSGYVTSKMIPKNNKVKIYQPVKESFKRIFSDVAKEISKKQCLVIIDSFNGLNNMFDEIESGIFINAITMLLSSISKQKNSIIVVSAMARKKENEGWVLSPGGRHIIESKNAGIFYLNGDEKALFLKILNKNQGKIFKIEQK
ncbi:ELP5 family protein [Nitrosopumilus sp. K4]|uniref:ELP5 family protein n=1 Tax=Nitrosopumilus sp. K4 TaxID=2795383 RepID=UPI0020120A24|nr:ELP5 family protein [Nitrosopumilus sp. K4]